MRKFLIVCVVVVGFVVGGFRAAPWVTGWWVAWQCSGDPAGESCITRVRSMGHTWSDRADLDRAGRWYLRGARAGDTQAMFHLGWVYQQIALDLRREEIQRRLAERVGLPPANPDIHPSSLENREADTRKYAEAAIAWYRKSAESGFAPSMNNLGLMVSLDLTGSPDDEEAFRWYLASARAGNPIGSMNLMMTYLLGRGTVRDPVEAAKWSLWRPGGGVTSDLKSPTLRRTQLSGAPERPPQVEEKLRFAARTGEAMVLNISPMKPSDAPLTLAEVRSRSPKEMR